MFLIVARPISVARDVDELRDQWRVTSLLRKMLTVRPFSKTLPQLFLINDSVRAEVSEEQYIFVIQERVVEQGLGIRKHNYSFKRHLSLYPVNKTLRNS